MLKIGAVVLTISTGFNLLLAAVILVAIICLCKNPPILYVSLDQAEATQLPEQDTFSFAIVGSVFLAFGLLSLLGLRDPLRFVPILLLQLSYKIIWFAGFLLPQSLTGQFHSYGIPIAILFASYVIGDLIAIPFPYLLSKKS